MKNNKGFTLIELLVVVLIIGILAGVALPQYQMAVTKAKVASILPLMRRFYDALAEWRLTNGDYGWPSGNYPSQDSLGASWPSDWKCWGMECENDYWYCFPNEEGTGYVYCDHSLDNNNGFSINMWQPDDRYYPQYAGMMTCSAWGTKAHNVCKALGGKKIDDWAYKLN